jgi:RNA polymerase sigma-70 factor (ECF subfamily)
VVLRRAGVDRAAAPAGALRARRLAAGTDQRQPPTANRQPTAASYLRAPGDTEFRAFTLDVLRIEGGAIAEITTFDARLFPAFGLPPTL